MIRLAIFFALMGFINFIGLGPQVENPVEYYEQSPPWRKLLMGAYVISCVLGDVIIIVGLMYALFLAEWN